MDSLIPYALVDSLLLVAVAVVMARRVSFWHPVTAYFFFHAYSFSWRAWQLVGGDDPMYAGNSTFDFIVAAEFERAMLWADVALVMFVWAAYLAHRSFERTANQPIFRRPFNKFVIYAVTAVCLPLGAFVFFTSKSGGISDNVFTETNYYQVLAMWPIGVLGLLIFAYGFRWFLVVPASIYLATVAVQGYHRYMLVLPLLFFASYYLQANRRRWPGLGIGIVALCLLLVMPRLKYIGRAFQEGDFADAAQLVVESFQPSVGPNATSTSEQFLDQYAGALSMTDDYGKVFYGSTYLAIVTLPVPRSIWPDKPGLGDHTIEISTNRRPYNIEGRIITYIGESYLNFRYFGLFGIPFLLGYVLTIWCLRATSGPVRRFDAYLYTVFSVAYIQLFRDGLLSLFVFTVVHNMPMLFTWFLHSVPGFAKRVQDYPPADPRAQEEPLLKADPALRRR